MGGAVKQGKWLYRNPPVATTADIPSAFPIRLTVREDPGHHSAGVTGIFEVTMAAWFRDESKPLGHDDHLTVTWRQHESALVLGRFGEGLIALGQAMCKDAAVR